MKNIIYLSIISVFLITSCDESFLDLTPNSNPNISSLYQNDNDFEQAVNGVYDEMQNYYRDYWQFGELRSDNGDHLGTGSDQFQRVDEFRLLVTDGVLNSTWQSVYHSIFRANMVLEQMEDADASLVPNMNRYEAEVRFLRALNYFNLVRIWGEIPLVLKTLSPEEGLEFPQTPENLIYESIISDLQFAADNLPESYSGNQIGRATEGAAKSILGKVYLTLEDFQKAESVLAEVLSLGYSLLSDYKSVFDHFNEHHSEYIFDIEYESDLSGEGSNFANQFIPNDAELRDQFGITGDVGETLNPTDDYFSIFSDNDSRKDFAAVRGFYQEDSSFFTTKNSFTMKYLTSVNTAFDSRVNWKVIRFADVLLMYAEALNENGKTDQALIELNKVRTRAGVETYSGLSQTEARDAIALERRLELGFEGHRWFDLVRTGKAYEVMSAKGYNMEEYQVLFPKPQQQLDVVNDPSVLSQNQGY